MEKLVAEDPQHIGAYRLLARLGAGGMGRVYLARSDRGRTVAVKLVRRELAEQEQFRSRFRLEVAAARRVGGAWTAPVLDADTEAPVPWLATGYVAGPSLQAVVSGGHGPLPERSVRILASGLAHALQDIHAAGLIHRDLKPSNVLVTIDGPRVIDFGIARALETVTEEGLTRTGALVGSPGFMAPEQVRGDRVTAACDVFCLGLVLAYAATGRLPFGATDSGVHALMYRIAQEAPDLSGLSDDLAVLVHACLQKEPAARPTTKDILARVGEAADAGAGPGEEPWLPGGLLARLGQHAVGLLEYENPTGRIRTPARDEIAAPAAEAPAQAPTEAPAAEAPPHTAPQPPVAPDAVPAHVTPQPPVAAGAVPGHVTQQAAAPGAAPGHAAPQPPVAPGPAPVPVQAPVPGPVPSAAPVELRKALPAATAPGAAAPPSTPEAAMPEPAQEAAARPAPLPVPVLVQPVASTPAPVRVPQPQPQPYGYPQPTQPQPGFGPTPAYGPPPPAPYGASPAYGRQVTPFGPTPPYGAAPAPAQQRPGRNPRGTAALIAVALIVAIAAGGSVYALMNGGGAQDDGKARVSGSADPKPPAGATARPSPSASASATEGTAEGAVPEKYLGTWTGGLDTAAGYSTRRLVIRQGEVGETVLSLTADGPAQDGGEYHCVFEAPLASAADPGAPLRIGPSEVTEGEPLSSCTPGKPTELTILPDGSLHRESNGGESLTYTKGG
ncbi:serine/threonine-protein kinase [Streptomyces lushanensis]|uniref:serine/threonine-protein kinase n=1 Tax=Streptomyces lushanensis TaxID=1434255 RepID=UPI0008313382|nr:serine/threonine-protein kinase [Streptomyces lushanensis]